MSEKTTGQEMLDKLSYKKKNIYEEASAEKIKAIYDIGETFDMHEQSIALTQTKLPILDGEQTSLTLPLLRIGPKQSRRGLVVAGVYPKKDLTHFRSLF